MLRCRCSFLVSSAIDSILEGSTFAMRFWVMHLEPHLLDNTGPLTRDTAVRFGVSFVKDYPLLCRIGMRHRRYCVATYTTTLAVLSVRSNGLTTATIRERGYCAFHFTQEFVANCRYNKQKDFSSRAQLR